MFDLRAVYDVSRSARPKAQALAMRAMWKRRLEACVATSLELKTRLKWHGKRQNRDI